MEEAVNKPLVCKLTTPELQKRKATVIAELRALVLGRNELGDGYSYRFDGSDLNLDRLTKFIKTERMCCDFFTFRLIVNENTAVLDVCGPPGVKEFLEMEVGL